MKSTAISAAIALAFGAATALAGGASYQEYARVRDVDFGRKSRCERAHGASASGR